MPTRFAELVQRKYVSRGMTASVAVELVHIRSDVSLGSVWSAYRGFAVAPKTAKKLERWAYVEHGVEDLDLQELVFAPERRRR